MKIEIQNVDYMTNFFFGSSLYNIMSDLTAYSDTDIYEAFNKKILLDASYDENGSAQFEVVSVARGCAILEFVGSAK